MDEHLLRYNKNQEYLFFDFETCSANLLSSDNLPWQLGMIHAKGEDVIDEKLFYIKWDKLPITKGAAEVTRFNPAEYEANAVDPKPVLDYFESLLYKPGIRIIAHNGLGFDIYIHKIWRKVLGKGSDWSYIGGFIDTDALARGIKENAKYKPGDDFLAYQFRMKNIIKKGLKTNLTALGKENKIEVDYESLHNGLNDVRLNKLVWEKWVRWHVEI